MRQTCLSLIEVVLTALCHQNGQSISSVFRMGDNKEDKIFTYDSFGCVHQKFYSTRDNTYGVRSRLNFSALIGLVCGFLVAFATLMLYESNIQLRNQMERHTTATEYYQTGFMAALQTVASNRSMKAPAISLDREIRVLCMVLTCSKYFQTRALHVRETWGKRCNKLIFISSESNEELEIVGLSGIDDSYQGLWNKTREGFRYVFEKYGADYDWFLKADDDTYVIMENLRYMLYGYYPETPIYFGHVLQRYHVEYMSGGAGYVLSKEALRRFMVDSFHNTTICPPAHKFGAEDFYMGICLQNVGVYLADSRLTIVSDNKPKFLPLQLTSYMPPDLNISIPNWLTELTPFQIETGTDCCSNNSIAFHYTEPRMMYTFEFLIYHLQAYGLKHSLLDLPQKMNLEEVKRRYKNNFNTEIVKLDEKYFPA